MMFVVGRAGSPSRPVHGLYPLWAGGSEIRPYQHPSIYIRLAKHTQLLATPVAVGDWEDAEMVLRRLAQASCERWPGSSRSDGTPPDPSARIRAQLDSSP